MKVIISAITILCLLYACRKEPSNKLVFPKIDSIHDKYLFTKETHMVQEIIGGKAHFYYNGNTLIKRVGGFLPIYGGAIYVTSIYDTLIYQSESVITITTKSSDNNFTVLPNKRELFFENGMLKKKITYGNTGANNNDTIYYQYDTKGKLIKAEQYFQMNIVTRDFTYYANGNLQSIVNVNKMRDNSIANFIYQETFGGYDNKSNPLKGFNLWSDMLYRSLSNNNFTTYSSTSANASEARTWRLIYDSNGNVDYSN